MPSIRTCKSCEITKPIDDFPHCSNKKTINKTYRHTCKICEKEQKREYHRNYYHIKIKPKIKEVQESLLDIVV
ncbi:MAG: hypothetical protein ACFFKA_08490 [Candidatus Thorarchaeota archaeon]|jgi:hypothetical protein